MFDLKGVGVV